MITLLAEPALFDARELRVEGESYQHLFRARRVAAGEEMRIVDGRGRARWGKVARVDRTTATVTLGEPAPAHEPALHLELLVPTCRPERASWLIEKATEVGVAGIRFLNMARAPRDIGSGIFDRLRRVAVSAVEQCHRSRLPEITGPHAWSEIGSLGGAGGAGGHGGQGGRWFLDTEAADPGGWEGADGSSAALLVGPEGGLDPGERRDLLAAGWRPVGLGERTLRLETAAVVGAAFLLLAPGPGIPTPAARN
jgi:16S rRNA (uracil1498-N3)-methyltransferase